MKTEEIEAIVTKRKRLTQKQLETRQHRLKDFLEKHFISGKYWTIEEIVENVRDSEGNPYYILNTNPRVHDRCIALANDVKELNWHTNRERYIPIIKDKKGSIKLAENKKELETYIANEKARIENTYKYYNHLNSLIELDGTTPFINLADRVLEEKEIKPIEVYAKWLTQLKSLSM